MATNTYVALDKKTIASNVSSVDFTGISGGYTDLVIVANVGSTVAEDYLQLRFNSDSATNYSTISIDGNGSGTRAGKSADRNAMFAQWNTATSNDITANLIINIQSYASTNIYKTVVARSNRATATTPTYTGTEGLIGVWRKTPEAITTITCLMASGSILAGSTFSLYGIAAEGISPAPKATGGAIYSDSTYYYHVFGSSGAFIPSQTFNADTLVLAGGGGSSGDDGGAGGAGGLCILLNSGYTSGTTYTATIGAGGTANTVNARGGQGINTTFNSITALGGGGGGYGNPAAGVLTGAAGGSGGGGGYGTSAAGGAATQGTSGGATGYGFAGGSGFATSQYGTGGGGGAGGAGGNGSATNGGAGGIGRTDSFINSIGAATGVGQLVAGNYYLAGGGGGSIGGSAAGGFWGAGGAGGGGRGGGSGGVGTEVGATAGLPNTGGGGGADTKAGGSGVVIVRYLKA